MSSVEASMAVQCIQSEFDALEKMSGWHCTLCSWSVQPKKGRSFRTWNKAWTKEEGKGCCLVSRAQVPLFMVEAAQGVGKLCWFFPRWALVFRVPYIGNLVLSGGSGFTVLWFFS